MTHATNIPPGIYNWPAILPLLRFRAETNPLGPAIDLLWDIPINASEATELPPLPEPDDIPLFILRRERRFPGKNRRGIIPQPKQLVELPPGVTPEDRTNLEGAFLTGQEDGFLVYDTAAFRFDFAETKEEWEGDRLITITRQYRYQGNFRDRVLIGSIRRESERSTTSGELRLTRLTVRFVDREGLRPGTIYYYTAFVGPEEQRWFSRLTQASALATGKSDQSLFTVLPQIHQRLDTTLPPPNSVARADRTKGQLQRFLEVFEAHADMFRGFIGGLRDLHNPRRVDSRFLPHLAHLIGWRLKDYLDEDEQRNEIGFAPEIYQIVGTSRNIQAIINRLTGWKAEIREFARNVLVSFDPNRLEQLESEEELEGETVYLDGNLFPTQAYLDYLDGITPVLQLYILGLSAQSELWLFLSFILPRMVFPPAPFPRDKRWHKRRRPLGSVDTKDGDAIDDQTAYTYHVVPRDEPRDKPDDSILYNQQTIGIYVSPDVVTETFSPEDTAERIRKILTEFLPIQVRAIFFLRPVVVEEAYDTIQEVTEESEDLGVLMPTETYSGPLEAASDSIPGWQLFFSNDPTQITVDTAALPVDTSFRTWHSALIYESLTNLDGDNP